ncbi:hypothetical protein D5S17_11315 [Pseudonocardiaceae bacterium YIM PH 21723]|nr:hypothetical protein D5S17_11315 [Pseudonocardiaceae bacterium YIM PH 21723]
MFIGPRQTGAMVARQGEDQVVVAELGAPRRGRCGGCGGIVNALFVALLVAVLVFGSEPVRMTFVHLIAVVTRVAEWCFFRG